MAIVHLSRVSNIMYSVFFIVEEEWSRVELVQGGKKEDTGPGRPHIIVPHGCGSIPERVPTSKFK